MLLAIDAKGCVCLSGHLGMQTVSDLVIPLARLVEKNPVLTIDLSAVSEADSAALALLLQAERIAEKNGHVIHVKACPVSLQSLLALYGLNDLLFGAKGEQL